MDKKTDLTTGRVYQSKIMDSSAADNNMNIDEPGFAQPEGEEDYSQDGQLMD